MRAKQALCQIMLPFLVLLLLLKSGTAALLESTNSTPEAVDSSGSIPTMTSVETAASCPPGFEIVNGICVDIDECSRLTEIAGGGLLEEDRRDVCGNYVHGHRPGYRCVNSPGSYSCERIVDCGFGYKLNKTMGVCIDIDECAVLGYEAACGMKLPIKVCINLEGSFRCDYRTCPSGRHLDRTTGLCNPCRRGYAKNRLGVCADIDECSSSNGGSSGSRRSHSCPPHMRCVNYIGGYECKHKIFCPMGRRANYNGTLCIDIDECAEHNRICGVGRNCINLDGSYRCESKQCGKLQELNSQTGECICTEGFRMNDTSNLCEDINECAEGRHNCDANDVCRNTRGHFDCLSRDKVCEPGFGLNFDHSSCIDIDECRLGQHKCIRHEVCNNTHGSYACLCAPGFHRTDSSRQCTDIDECAINGTGLCPTPLICRNSPGSFTCACPDGFQRNESDIGSTCIDIDECSLQPDICSSVGTCQNRPEGAYTCTCPAGYMATDLVGGTCTDIDECKLDACPAGAACRNTPGNYDCQCRQGFVFARRSNLCEDIDECQEEDNECSSNGTSCFNYRGGFACYRNACPEGFGLVPSPGIQQINILTFSCKQIDSTCWPVPSFHDTTSANSSSQSGVEAATSKKPVCIKRHRIVHKAQDIQAASRGKFVLVQTDMRVGQRDCRFRATLVRASGLRTTAVQVAGLPVSIPSEGDATPTVRFQQKHWQGRYTMCSTEVLTDVDGNSTDPITSAIIEVALIKDRTAEIFNSTVHLIYL